MKINFSKLILTIIFSYICCHSIKAQYNSLYESLPFKATQPALPVIPETRVSLLDFGGNPDGSTLNTDAFIRALDYLEKAGGGHLDVTDGIWLTGPVRLRSNIDIHLSHNCIILFSHDKSLYPVTPADKGTSGDLCTAPFNASGIKNFSITGSGIIDGNGEAWRPVKRFKVSDAEWKSMSYLNLTETKEDGSTVWYPTLGNENGKIAKKRPRLLRFIECSNFLIQGVVIQNSPSFHVNMILSHDFIIDGITVRCPWNAQNGDGIDLSSCNNALLTNCSVDAGDDAICLKSGIGEVGRDRGPCSEIVIQNCTVFHGHGGFVIGSDTSGGMKNIYVNKCRFIDTDTGLRLKSGRDRGGMITDIWIDDVVMCDIAGEAVLFDCYYQEKVGDAADAPAAPLSPDTPELKG
ncbi:MAG: glycoside hydrolase family 28 protein [Duncaniella sp.]|nr:glycoside hydrolase family 28 protein [Duncaniella sp.]